MELNMVQVRDRLADVINRVAYGGERVVLKRRAKDVAAVVSMEDLKLLEELEDRADVKAALRARKEGGKPIPLAQLESELGIRKKLRARRSGRTG